MRVRAIGQCRSGPTIASAEVAARRKPPTGAQGPEQLLLRLQAARSAGFSRGPISWPEGAWYRVQSRLRADSATARPWPRRAHTFPDVLAAPALRTTAVPGPCGIVPGEIPLWLPQGPLLFGSGIVRIPRDAAFVCAPVESVLSAGFRHAPTQ